MRNSYWEHNGAEQAKYDEMMAKGWEFTKKNWTVFYSYYRYFNDGDFPGWARTDWSLIKFEGFGICMNKVLNDKGLELQEQRVTEAILREYKRFKKEDK